MIFLTPLKTKFQRNFIKLLNHAFADCFNHIKHFFNLQTQFQYSSEQQRQVVTWINLFMQVSMNEGIFNIQMKHWPSKISNNINQNSNRKYLSNQIEYLIIINIIGRCITNQTGFQSIKSLIRIELRNKDPFVINRMYSSSKGMSSQVLFCVRLPFLIFIAFRHQGSDKVFVTVLFEKTLKSWVVKQENEGDKNNTVDDKVFCYTSTFIFMESNGQ